MIHNNLLCLPHSIFLSALNQWISLYYLYWKNISRLKYYIISFTAWDVWCFRKVDRTVFLRRNRTEQNRRVVTSRSPCQRLEHSFLPLTHRETETWDHTHTHTHNIYPYLHEHKHTLFDGKVHISGIWEYKYGDWWLEQVTWWEENKIWVVTLFCL